MGSEMCIRDSIVTSDELDIFLPLFTDSVYRNKKANVKKEHARIHCSLKKAKKLLIILYFTRGFSVFARIIHAKYCLRNGTAACQPNKSQTGLIDGEIDGHFPNDE